MTDSNYVDLFSAVIQRAATSAANRLSGPKAGALEGAARLSAGAGVPGNVTYDEDEKWLVVHRGALRVACNLGPDPVTVPVGGRPLLWWDEPVVNRTESAVLIPGWSFAILEAPETPRR